MSLPVTDLRVSLGWMTSIHLPGVMKIESESFVHPWTIGEIMSMMRKADQNGMVAEARGRIVGFAIYRYDKSCLEILDVAVALDCRRHGVAAQMVAKLLSRLKPGGKTRLEAIVSERNLDAHLFFRSMGFRATGVIPDHYNLLDGGHCDAYEFVYRLRPEKIFLPTGEGVEFLPEMKNLDTE